MAPCVLDEIVDDRRHLLLGHPGIDVHDWVAGFAFVERGVDEGTSPLVTIGSPALRAALVSIEISTFDLLLEDQRVESLLRAGRA